MVESEENIDQHKEIADLCVEFWKLAKGTAKAIKLLPEAEGKRLAAQIRYSERQLERLSQELGLRLVDFESEDFHPGLAASADNAEDFDDGTPLVVTKTLEPTVVQDMRVVRTGRVLVELDPSTKEKPNVSWY